jgi:hypothetical protein
MLDGEVEDAGAIQAHLDVCPECRSVFDGYRKVGRLASMVADVAPGSRAWEMVESKLSHNPSSRFMAVVPAAAAAGIALVIYVLAFTQGGGRQAIGFLTRKTGPVKVMSSEKEGWVEPDEKGEVFAGDKLQTDSGAAARIRLNSGGFLILDGQTRLCIRGDEPMPPRIMVESGRAFACFEGQLCLEAGRGEARGTCCGCIMAIEDGVPVLYVRSGAMDCRLGEMQARVESMQRLMMDLEADMSPSRIEDPGVFDCVDNLIKLTEGQK